MPPQHHRGMETAVSSPHVVCTHGVTSSASKLLHHGLLCPQGHRSCQEWASHGVVASLGTHLLWHGVLFGLQVDLCSPTDLHGLRVYSCLSMGCAADCREISALVPKAPPACSSSLTLVSAELIPSRCHSSLCMVLHFFFSLLLNHITPEVLPTADGLSFVQWWVHLGAGWHWLCWRWGRFLGASHRTILLPKPGHQYTYLKYKCFLLFILQMLEFN